MPGVFQAERCPLVCNCSHFLTQGYFSTSSSTTDQFYLPTQPCFLLQSCTYLLLCLGIWLINLPFSLSSDLFADRQGTTDIITTWDTKLNSNSKRLRERGERSKDNWSICAEGGQLGTGNPMGFALEPSFSRDPGLFWAHRAALALTLSDAGILRI